MCIRDRLYVARRVFEQTCENTYVVSLSSRTIVYKGMFLVGQLLSLIHILSQNRESLCEKALLAHIKTVFAKLDSRLG